MKCIYLILFSLFVCLPAVGHQMELVCSVEGEELVVAAWIGRDEVVQGGDVTILSSDGSVLAMGKTNNEGLFRWKPKIMQPVTIEVYAGSGHNQSITLSENELRDLFEVKPVDDSDTSSDVVSGSTETNVSKESGRRGKAISTQDDDTSMKVVLGLVFLLAAVSAWFSYRNSQKLRELERWIKDRES